MSAWAVRAGVALALLATLGAELVRAPEWDEWLPLACAERLAAGEVPYRDFRTHYGPLVPALHAAALAASRTVLATRLAFLPLLALGLVAAWRLAAARAGDERRGAVVGALAALLVAPVWWGTSLLAAAALLLAAAWGLEAAARARARGAGAGDAPGDPAPPWRPALAGALLGLAGLARHDLAGAAGAALVAGAALTGPRPARREVVAFAAAAALPPLGVAAWLAAAGGLAAAADDLVLTPLACYAAGRRLAWPAPWAPVEDGAPALAALYGPFVLGLLALLRAALDRRAGRADEARAAALAGALALVATAPGWVRCDRAHLAPAALVALPALGALLRAPLDAPRAAALGLALAAVLPGAWVAAGAGAARVGGLLSGSLTTDPRPLLRGLVDDPGARSPARAAALARVAALTALSDRIYVGLASHDRIWVNDVPFYVEAGRLPATREHELEPWDARPERQARIVADLERTRPPVVVLRLMPPSAEPNESAAVHPPGPLDPWLVARYRLAAAEGRYAVLARDDARPGSR